MKCKNCDNWISNGDTYCRDCTARAARIVHYKDKPDYFRYKLRKIVGRLYIDAKIGDFSAKIQEILKSGDNLYMWGPVGVGKTYAAAAVLRVRMESGYGITKLSFSAFCRRLRSSYTDQGESEHQIVSSAQEVDILLIDDLGLEDNPPKQFSNFTLYDLINYRLEEGKQTIITSNIPISGSEQSITNLFGARIADRLTGYMTIKLDGKSKRKKIRRLEHE